ncbi:EamA family transporter [Candidatus Kaiserbacteria bacterium]|nr:EamA family transporter [Candidatus Kaiserbacteria bacterium]
MPAWILFAVIAQFFNAIVALVDKYIVTSKKAVPEPFVYAFYTCVLSGAAIVIYIPGLLPVSIDGVTFPDVGNVRFPTLEVLGLSILSAYTFFYALVSMFKALQQADASDVVPVVGAVSAIGSLALAYLFLGATLSAHFAFGVILLALGTLLVSHFRLSWKGVLTCISSGIFFSLHYVVIKGLFNETSFDDGFFWSRVGFVLFAISLLLIPSHGKRILPHVRATRKRIGALVVVNKVIAGVASVLVLKATELGDVSVVQALGGLQFLFIFIFGVTLGPHTPFAYGENTRDLKVFAHKAVFVAIIILGFWVLFG